MDSSLVYLTQTGTTVCFLSFDDKKLSMIKQRDLNKKTLQVIDKAFRVVNQDLKHYSFLKKFHTLYSTSANLTQNSFDEDFAIKSADIIVFNEEFKESTPSSIYVLSKSRKKKIR